MPDTVLDAYNTLSLEAQKEVEHLIYFLASQQKKEKTGCTDSSNILDSFVGKCTSWKNEDILEYQRKLRSEERV